MNDQSRQHVQVIVPDGISPQRLDQYLAAQEELNLSRTKLQRLIDAGDVLVDSKRETVKYMLRGGERIDVLLPGPPKTDVAGEAIPLEVVYEDDFLAVINKPVGMVTHPAAGNYSGTLVNALVHRFKRLPSGYGTDRPGIVHRLDKNTSGLLIVAKQEDTLLLLQQAMVRRDIKRTYLALICGHMPKDTDSINLPIGRSTRDRTKMAVAAAGRQAVTEYQLRTRFRSYDLLDVHLQTGRTHQIRVHFSHLGHPVFGDPEYGGREKWLRGVFAPERPLARQLLDILPSQALHARRLEFIHPHTSRQLALEANPPEAFQRVIDTLFSRGV